MMLKLFSLLHARPKRGPRQSEGKKKKSHPVFGQLLLTLVCGPDSSKTPELFALSPVSGCVCALRLQRKWKTTMTLVLTESMQWKTTFHIERAGDKYPWYIIGKFLNAEQQILLGHGEQCSAPQGQWKQGLRGEAEVLGPEEPGSGRWLWPVTLHSNCHLLAMSCRAGHSSRAGRPNPAAPSWTRFPHLFTCIPDTGKAFFHLGKT